jgi:anti-sigma regulatory factor (Ser/Thr protein kinase)
MGRDLAALLARERGVAETLQHSLLPQRLPELPGVEFAARYEPGAVGSQVGGDWYDVVPLPGGRVGLVMGDVVGHDLRAAADMGQLRNALRACAADGAPPAEVLHTLNRLCVSQELGDMASVLYAVLDPVQGVVEVANAGHLPPLLVTADESCYLESAPSPPVGVVREATFRSATWEVPPGSLLLLYTDGLVERRAVGLEPRLERLCEVVTARRGADLERLCDAVLSEMQGGEPSDDDVALLLVAPQATLGPHVEVTWPANAARLALLRHLLERWLGEVGAQEDEVYDVLVACSEAATNAVEHAYGPARADFRVTCTAQDGGVTVVVRDWGQWREPRGRDRGRGLGLMEGLMDDVQVSHSTGGTEVRLHRRLRQPQVTVGRELTAP